MALLTLAETKTFLRVVHTEDDDYIQLCTDAAIQYLYNSTGYTYTSNKLAKLFCLCFISDCYDNRTFVSSSEKMRLTLDSILHQLRYSGGVDL